MRRWDQQQIFSYELVPENLNHKRSKVETILNAKGLPWQLGYLVKIYLLEVCLVILDNLLSIQSIFFHSSSAFQVSSSIFHSYDMFPNSIQNPSFTRRRSAQMSLCKADSIFLLVCSDSVTCLNIPYRLVREGQLVRLCCWRSTLPRELLGDGSGIADPVYTDLWLLRFAKVRACSASDLLRVLLVVHESWYLN